MKRSLPCGKCLKTKGNRRRRSGRTSVKIAEQFDSPHQQWWGSFLVGFAHRSSGALTIRGESNPSTPLRGAQDSILSLSKDRTALSEGAPHLRSTVCEGRPSRRAHIMSTWFYILRLHSSHLYAGSTRSLEKRIKDHFAGRACRTTKIDPPIALIHSEEFASYKEAFRREHQVKHWSRAKKEALISGDLQELKKLARRKR